MIRDYDLNQQSLIVLTPVSQFALMTPAHFRLHPWLDVMGPCPTLGPHLYLAPSFTAVSLSNEVKRGGVKGWEISGDESHFFDQVNKASRVFVLEWNCKKVYHL